MFDFQMPLAVSAEAKLRYSQSVVPHYHENPRAHHKESTTKNPCWNLEASIPYWTNMIGDSTSMEQQNHSYRRLQMFSSCQ
jgi:hypothetical protein